ncbi:MAG TPA: glycosyltransferase WbuB, partial [Methanophagales archaeon]|nr:glycosyltransferase WbuB [Methanophagales archaeon]
MRILLVSTQDYIHHPIPSRHHYIFEELAKRHEVHVPHFHVSRGKERETRLIVHEATKFPVREPILHYTLNAPFQYAVFKKIIKEEGIDVVVAAHIFAGAAVIHAAKKYGVPVVFDLKDWFPDSAAAYYKNKVMKWILREGVWRITKHNLDRSDRITTVSPSLVEKLKKYGYDAKLITNGVDTDIFKPMDSRAGKRMLGLDEDCFVMGYVG